MNRLYLKGLTLLVFFTFIVVSTGNAQLFHKNTEKQLFGKSNRKEVKVKQSSKVHKSKRAQEANDRKLKKNYEKSVKHSQKRTMDIQTPEVKTRMKNNKKEVDSRDKSHKRKNKAGTRRGARKYK